MNDPKFLAIIGMGAIFFVIIAIRERIRVYKAKKEMEKYEAQAGESFGEAEMPPEAEAMPEAEAAPEAAAEGGEDPEAL